MEKRTQNVEKILLSTKLKISEDVEKLLNICRERHIEIKYDDRLIERLASKENSFVIGVFKKYTLSNHLGEKNLVLVSPSDMGNLGTIMRTMLGFGIKDLVM